MHDDETIPDRLADDLAELTRSRVFVPPDRDRFILEAAAARLGPIAAGHRRAARFRLIVPAAAAAIALSSAVAITLSHWRAVSESRPSPIAGDLDASGSIDIVDAYVLALALDRQVPFDPSHDLNGDGVIDRADVDALATSAVALTTPGGAG